MRAKSLPEPSENQGPLDLETGCHWSAIPGTGGIRLLVPTREASARLERTLDIPGRLSFIRNIALQGIGESEVFAQKSFSVGHTEAGILIVLIVSVLTNQRHWRGGWFAFSVPTGEEERLQKYLHIARAQVVADLRRERAQQGSNS